MSEKLNKSLENGTHRFLNDLTGKYKGITNVWFEPGILADTSECSGEIRPVLDGKFVLHEYHASIQGKPLEGIAIYGCSLGDEKLQSAWVDTFHNGTAIMFSENELNPGGYSVLGQYGKEPKWGWRTQIEKKDNGTVVITMFNITPEGQSSKAVETIYEKV